MELSPDDLQQTAEFDNTAIEGYEGDIVSESQTIQELKEHQQATGNDTEQLQAQAADGIERARQKIIAIKETPAKSTDVADGFENKIHEIGAKNQIGEKPEGFFANLKKYLGK